MLIRFNKPYGVLSQFTPEGRWRGLKDHIDLPGVYVAGRLDADSEGLLLLTDDGVLQARIADPRFKMEKTYWVQVEGVVDDKAHVFFCFCVVWWFFVGFVRVCVFVVESVWRS